MAKSSPNHHPFIHISADVYGDAANVLVKFETYLHKQPIGQFWIPRTALDYNGQSPASIPRIPDNVLKARALHDLNLTYGSYSFSAV